MFVPFVIRNYMIQPNQEVIHYQVLFLLKTVNFRQNDEGIKFNLHNELI